MTTKVTVDAHAGWPVEVKTVNVNGDGSISETAVVVPPHTERDFYIHSHMYISTVREMDLPEQHVPAEQAIVDAITAKGNE
jgi:hypothetical protein